VTAQPRVAGGSRVDTIRLQRLVHAYRGSAALMAALELGLFTAVARGAGDVTGVADALGLGETNAERLVTACVALGLLERDGERLRNAPDVARFLVLHGSTGIAHSVPECVGYLERAGFREVAAHEFVPTVLTRVVGRKTT
jgi:hypothetical protein